IHPLVRWQYRGGLPEEDWNAFLFEDVRTVKGGRSPFRVGVGVLAASRYVYATGLGCAPDEIAARWERALAERIAPTIVETGPVHEEVHTGDALLEKGGTAEFPIPISTPVIEGYITTDELEEEASFGESHGYMQPRQLTPFFEVTAITHRKDALWVSFISQVTPSESSVIKKVAYEPIFTQHLRQTCNIRSVKRVVMHEPLTNLRKLIVVQMANGAREAEIWRALRAASSFNQGVGKICVAVDED